MAAATEAPDPRSLKSAEDAFRYPVVTVRAMERRLRVSVAENQDKLRSLVGASYRDLLDTARTIIRVDTQLRSADTLLASTARNADSRNIDRLARNAARLNSDTANRSRHDRAVEAHMYTIERCTALAERLHRQRASTLLAAKLRSLAQILRQSILQWDTASSRLDDLGRRLGASRARFMRSLDQRLASLTASTDLLVEDLTAFCFVNRLKASDALTHFLRVREQSLLSPADHDTGQVTAQDHVLRRLRLFILTVQQARAVFPDLLPAALKRLAAQPLVADPALLEVRHIRLDLTTPWFADNVKAFVPWTRQEDMPARAIDTAIRSWSGHVMEQLPAVLRHDLQSENDAMRLTNARRESLQHWLSSRSTARGLLPRDGLKSMQQPFMQRFQELATEAADDLSSSLAKAVSLEVSQSEVENDDEASWSLWTSHADASDLADGAASFRENVVRRRMGRSPAIARISSVFDEAAARLLAIQRAVDKMRDTRWEDDYAGDDDDDDVHGSDADEIDDTEEEAIHATLSRQDPADVQGWLRKVTQNATITLEKRLAASAGQVSTSGGSSGSSTVTEAFLIRTIRILRVGSASLLASTGSSPSALGDASMLCAGLATSLQGVLVTRTLTCSEAVLDSALARYRARPLHMRALWDTSGVGGASAAATQPLPAQPAPWTLRYLRALTAEMAGRGLDLWCSQAVDRIRGAARIMIESKVLTYVEHASVVREPIDEATDAGRKEEDEGKADDREQDAGTDQNGEAHSDSPTQAEKQEVIDEKEAEHANGPLTSTNDLSVAGQKSRTAADQQLLREKALQLLFDTLFMQAALWSSESTKQVQEREGPSAIAQLRRLSGAGDGEEARMQKGARESWRKSHVLFGLLCT